MLVLPLPPCICYVYAPKMTIYACPTMGLRCLILGPGDGAAVGSFSGNARIYGQIRPKWAHLG